MKTESNLSVQITLTTFDRQQLRHALTDFRAAPCAYPILALHGYMERTPDGYHAIDPRTLRSRINELLAAR